MKYVLTLAAMLVASVAGTALAGEGHVSDAQLTDMGLPGIQVMSDAQGSKIRGQGFAYAISVSASSVPGGSFDGSLGVGLGFHHAQAISGSASAAELDVTISGPLGIPLFNIMGTLKAGSTGYAAASAY